jgi:putative DNA primase/helicase
VSLQPECGKTTCLDLLRAITARALNTSNVTASAVFRSVEKWCPSLLIDEADTFIRDNDDLRGILNCGHHRSSAFVIRTTGDNHEPKRFCTWAPKAVALIGKLPPTLTSRAIHVALKRMLPGDRIVPLREGRTRHLDLLKRKAARWAEDYAHDLRAAADPKMPRAFYGRAADNWRPLFVIADLVGGDWPERARTIAEKLSGRREDLATILILQDIATIFAEKGAAVLKSEEAIEVLVKMEDRPWPEWRNQKPITPRQLAKLLEPFEIAPKQHWLEGGINRRGYHVDQFQDALKRYLGGNLSAMPLEPSERAIFSDEMQLEAQSGLADLEPKKPSKLNRSSGLADGQPQKDTFGADGDPFASLKDPSLKLKARVDEYPELPPFLDRRDTTQGS